jgi:hypothetical protein
VADDRVVNEFYALTRKIYGPLEAVVTRANDDEVVAVFAVGEAAATARDDLAPPPAPRVGTN